MVKKIKITRSYAGKLAVQWQGILKPTTTHFRLLPCSCRIEADGQTPQENASDQASTWPVKNYCRKLREGVACSRHFVSLAKQESSFERDIAVTGSDFL